MYQLLVSLLFAGAFVTAMTVITVMFAEYREKMIAALTFRPQPRRTAPWRSPPRRPARVMASVAVARPRISRAAA